MFHIEYDHSANCLNIRVAGFWKPEDVAVMAREAGAKALAARAIRPDFNACVESLEFPVQAMDVAELLATSVRAGLSLTTGRAAIVVGSQLNKVQAERTLADPRLRVFLTLEAARTWLAAPQ